MRLSSGAMGRQFLCHQRNLRSENPNQNIEFQAKEKGNLMLPFSDKLTDEEWGLIINNDIK